MASTEEPKNSSILSEKQREAEEESEAPVITAGEEDTGAQIAPIVKLQEVAVATGEEDEDVLLDLKAKLYRFDKEGNLWKERGAGSVKLLKHRKTSKVRLVMRQSKTLKICANHFVAPSISVQEHAGNEKSCVWHALDYADGELKEELFCIRFASVENCKTFQKKIEEVAESQEQKYGESKEANSAANLLEKLSVGENKDKEEQTEETKTFQKKIEKVAESQEQKSGESEEADSAVNLLGKLSAGERQTQDQEEKTKETPVSAEKKENENMKQETPSDE